MEHVAVIGGSSGMGLGIAKTLHAEGYRVVVGGRSIQNLEKAKQLIGADVQAEVIDITKPELIKSFFSSLTQLDHLIITASDAFMGNFTQMDEQISRNFFDSKFWGPASVAREALSKLNPAGSITFFSGAAGRRASAGFTIGSVINAAVESLTKNLALELAPLRVNAIVPGLIDTPVWDKLMSAEDKRDFFVKQSQHLPLRRMGTIEDIASAAKFLIQNKYVTGTSILVDGGYLLVN